IRVSLRSSFFPYTTLFRSLYQTTGVFSTTADVPVDPATGRRYRMANGEYFQGGDPYWKDVDHNYILNGDDRMPSGNTQPLVTGRSEEHTSELQSRFDIVCR